ncbi:MAG: MaoC family dehydratase N-terminal domain-containing protein [Propionibacteriaceae bacterium]|nr:MaoC family dehydratase N-terminal domain-containing protein [Propionibacteriaceae bacterium]
MPISQAHVGRSYATDIPYVVSAAKITEFAKALGDGDNPAYKSDSAVAPPTFAALITNATLELLFADPELELSLSNTIHVAQSFEHTRPLRINDSILAKLTIDSVKIRASMALVSITVTLTDASGKNVCVAASTLMHQGVE